MRGVFDSARLVKHRVGIALVSGTMLTASLLIVPNAAAAPLVPPGQGSKGGIVAELSAGAHRAGSALAENSTGGTSPTGSGNREVGAVKGALTQIESAAPVLIVHTDSTAAVGTVAAAAGRKSLVVRHRFNSLQTLSVQVPTGQLTSTLATLKGTPGVTSVQVAIPRQLLGVPNDPDLAGHQNGYLTAVTAPAAWAAHHSSPSVLIAIVDSGVDVTHPDLAGKVVGQYNAVDGSSDVTDDVGHGTFVAGVAAASTNNGIGVAGAGYDAGLLAVKISGPDGTIYDDAEAAGIMWAADHGARIINLSFGSATASQLDKNAIDYAVSKGALIVAAAGNDGADGNPTFYPAAYPDVLAVGATNGNARAPFSEHGSWVDVAAPGVGIFSTTPRAGSTFFGPNYDVGDGTSFSAPLVAGQAALLLGGRPETSADDLRAAIVGSAHGLAGLGLGSGLVDFRASFDHLRPTGTPQITAPATGGTVSAAVTLAALSTAPTVRFKVDGAWLGVAVAPRAGTARTTWSTWGLSNGRHTIGAQQCSASGLECSRTIASVTVTVTNGAPKVTAPGAAATVSGTFTMAGTSAGGGLAFYLDGVRRGFDASAPYAVTYSGSALTDGRHRVRVVQCSVTGASCSGPSSADVVFSTRSLHPAIVAVSPNPFSPNGDTRKDTATVSYRLPDVQIVAISILNVTGGTVYGPLRVGAVAAGQHSWVWTGRDNHGRRPADGTYSVLISTNRMIGSVMLRGSASHAVVVDTSAPTLTGITGSNATFYPKLDTYLDAFTPRVVMGSPGRLTLTIRDARGPVRTIAANFGAGRQSLTWNGRNQANVIVPAGRFTWTLTASDAVGNTRTTPSMPVTVSLKSLVGKSATLIKNGIDSYSSGVSDTSCAAVDTAHSDFYPRGRWLVDTCNDPSEIAASFYTFTLPAATQYRSLQLSAYGNTFYGPTRLRGMLRNPSTGKFDITAGVQVSSHANAWYTVGTAAAATHVSGRVVTSGVFVTTESRYVSDFDIGQVRLVVTYAVLQ